VFIPFTCAEEGSGWGSLFFYCAILLRLQRLRHRRLFRARATCVLNSRRARHHRRVRRVIAAVWAWNSCVVQCYVADACSTFFLCPDQCVSLFVQVVGASRRSRPLATSVARDAGCKRARPEEVDLDGGCSVLSQVALVCFLSFLCFLFETLLFSFKLVALL
jgi:hypothetical protein